MATKRDPLRHPRDDGHVSPLSQSWLHERDKRQRGGPVDSVFDAIWVQGHDEDYVPVHQAEPTQAVPGSAAKVEVLRQRLAAGQPLWHPDDRCNHEGLVGGRVRNDR